LPRQLWLALLMPWSEEAIAALEQWIGTVPPKLFYSIALNVWSRAKCAHHSTLLSLPRTGDYFIFVYVTAITDTAEGSAFACCLPLLLSSARE
jgi:hypothetical protein